MTASSPVTEAYLETIYNLAMENQTVRAVDLASHFNVSRPTVTQTLRRLSEAGLVSQARPTGVTLTDRGRSETEALLRRHRLAERLLFDVLGMDFVAAHEQAHALEHWISPEVERKISELLRMPATCPHGNPIPGNGPAGVDYLRDQQGVRLADVEPGETVVVIAISEVVEDESALLRSLLDTGIVPGHRLVVEPAVDGEVAYRTASGRRHRLSRSLAVLIWVRSLSPESGQA